MMARLSFWLTLLLVAAAPASAHEVRPAYLQIHEIEPFNYEFLWKTPAQGDMRLALNVVLPPGCRNIGEPRTAPAGAAVIQHWRSVCERGLPGKRIAIENLQTTLTDVIVRFEPLTGRPKLLRMDGASPAVEIPAQQTVWEVAGTYFRLGVEHILFGFDHLLFVLCLLLLVGNFKRLIGAVTAFTVAHSITLAGTTFGWLRLASAPIEACIALSIAFVAAEIIKAHEGNRSTMQRWPWLASFGFGLLHGFGFAAALREIGLPEGAVPFALLFFNVGVEAGQIVFVCCVLVMTGLARRFAPALPPWVYRVPPYAAGVVACFWFIERSVNVFR